MGFNIDLIDENVQNTYGYHGELPQSLGRLFKQNGKYGFKDRNETVVIPPIIDGYKSLGYSGRGSVVRVNEKWGAINERGEWMFKPEYEDIITAYPRGHFVRFDGKYGFCNEKGIFTIDFKYDELKETLSFNDSVSYFLAKQNGKWGIVIDDDKVLLSIEYDSVHLHGDWANVTLNKKNGCINIKTGASIPVMYDYISGFGYGNDCGEMVVCIGNCYGVIDIQGKYVLPLDFEDLHIEKAGFYRAKKNGLYGLVSKNGCNLFPYKYKRLETFDANGMALAQREDDMFGYINQKDDVIIPFTYSRAENFCGNYAVVGNRNGLFGVIDRDGMVIVPLIYGDVIFSAENVVLVSSADKFKCLYGLYDLESGYALPCHYEKIELLERRENEYIVCKCWLLKPNIMLRQNVEPIILMLDLKTGKIYKKPDGGIK